MKRKFYFYSLLMAIVMMVVSPTIMWAVSMGDDDDDTPTEEQMPDQGQEEDQQQEQEQDDPCMSGAHSLEETSRSPATCTEVGYINYSCINCGVGYTVYDDPIGHNFTNGVCDNCGALESGEDGEAGSGDFIYISGSEGFDREGAEKLIDGNDRTKWCSIWYEDSKPYVIFKAAEPISITGYSMVHGNDTGTKDGQGREWAEWTIYGANFASDAEATEDSEEWQEVDSRSGFSYGYNYSFSDLSCGLYQYYKIVVESNYSGDLQQMAEIHFTYDACEHQWGEDGKCTICGYKCKHQELGEDGKCTVCNLYVHTFASLDELLAADQDYDAVNVTIDDEVLLAMPAFDDPSSYTVIFSSEVRLLAPAPDPALNWVMGGRVTGTLTNVDWNKHDNLLRSDDAAFWSNLEYTAPELGDVLTYNSIADLLADENLTSETNVNVTVSGTIAMAEYISEINGYQIMLDNGFAIGAMGCVTSDPGWAVGGTVSGTLQNVTFFNGDVVGVMSMTTNIFAPGASLEYTEPGPVASVTINGVETTYSDINEAFDAVYYSKNSTLKLLTDVEVPFGFPFEPENNVTLDLNNHTYTASLNEENNQYAFEIFGANVTVKNGTINSNNLAAFNVESNSTLTIDNCTIETGYDGIWVDNSSCVVNIINTNVHKITGTALYVNGILNISGNCSFSNDCSTYPICVGADYGGAINLDLGYMMVDKNGERITRLIDDIGSGIVSVVVDPDAVPECAVGSHTMEHHDGVDATCTTTGKAEYWACTTCGRVYADEDGNTRLPFGIIPDTPLASHNYVDGACTVCGDIHPAEPVMVTAENYEELGLDEKYVGYYAIQNIANLAFFAEDFGSRITPATEPEVGEGNGGNDVPKARLRTNMVKENNQQQKARGSVLRKAAAEQGNFLGFVLTNDIVVNANLLDANGKAKDRDNNGNIRADLLAWEPVDLYCGEYSELIFDGNGHTISGLYQNTPFEYNSLGFIDEAYEGVTIKNLGITDSYFGSIMKGYNSSMGSIVCRSNANIENCWSDATIDVQNADYIYIGGLVGQAFAGNISDSYFSGRIMSSGAYEVAGLVADINCNDDVTISNCHFSGSMSCEQGNIDYCGVAGLINYISAGDNNIVIERCYADGKIDVKGSNAIASGLFCNQYTNGGTAIVRNNYNAMTVNAPNYYGLFNYAEGNGIIAFNVNADKNADFPYSGAYIDGYFNISVADEENDYDGGFVIEVTEEQMASGAVAYRLNMLNEMSGPGEVGPVVGPGEGEPGESEPVESVPVEREPVEREPVVPYARLRAAAEETAPVWYQLIGEDAHPVLSGDEYSIVYCDDEEPTPASVFYNKVRTFDTYTLADGTEYTFKSKTNVAELTYTRNVSESQVGNWQALYIPFKMPVAELKKAGFDAAAINNFHEYTDEDGKLIGTDLEIKMLTSGTLKENWPYLIRPTVAGEKNITLENVTLAPARENEISCSSIEKEYTFHGTYQPMTGLNSDGYMFLNGGSLCTAANDDQVLKAQRWYLNITNKYDDNQMADNDQSPAEANQRISLRVIGEDDASGIDEIRVVSTKAEKNSAAGIYDIMGRKLSGMSKGINIIRQSDGTVKKVLITK